MYSRLVLVEQLAQHRDEDVDGVGRPSLRVAQQPAFGGADRRVDTRGTSASCRRSDRARGLAAMRWGEFLLYHLAVMRLRRALRDRTLRSVHRRCVWRRARHCSGSTEYEEEMYLSLDGSATRLRQQLDCRR